MTLSQLRAELQARGFDYEDDTDRLDRWINQSYHELCEEAPWPFLENSASGTAPLTISDVRQILSVSDTTQGSLLDNLDRRDVVSSDPDVNDTGTPTHYYLDNLTLRVFPLNTTDTISVRYIKTPSDLSGASDEPLVPSRYQGLIVDLAVVKAYKDDDQLDSAATVKQDYETGVLKMRRALMSRDISGTDSIVITDLEGWTVG